eukprot:TRINITY_DN1586_c0_g1_i1.p1 TRINITY_DN1586_c0_g1~~TRINITY_DN1586_c0_g1_i1.p1  ORF type:complete len:1399 (+),score=355.16 TRINITY_DN1586_c0_g1_i1:622-4197(+)
MEKWLFSQLVPKGLQLEGRLSKDGDGPGDLASDDLKGDFLERMRVEVERVEDLGIQLQLQHSFKEVIECVFRVRELDKKGKSTGPTNERKRQLQRDMKMLAEGGESPIIKTFLDVVALHEQEARILAFSELERLLVRASHGTVHLWREVSHLYEASPHLYKELPAMAAQHLLDGFSLELMDGDASAPCIEWISAVFKEFCTLVKNEGLQILTLSILGEQSSGKSTLCNILFGTSMKASAGACTRGVHMQMVKAEGFNAKKYGKFDYILLLDTEGLRAPVKSSMKQKATTQDNRMAMFAIMLADATMFLIDRENIAAVEEILPIVNLAFIPSQIAAKTGGRLRSRLMVAFTKTSTVAKDKLQDIRETMVDTVNEGFRAAESAVFQGQKDPIDSQEGTSSSPTETLQSLHALGQDTTILRLEDIKIFGDLWWGARFDSQYGATVVDSLDGLIESVVRAEGRRWKASTLITQGQYLSEIWECVLSSEFYTHFRDMVEYKTRRNLTSEVEKLNAQLVRKAMDLHREHEKNLPKKLDTLKKEIPTATQLQLEEKIKEDFREEFKLMEKIFCEDLATLLGRNESYEKWRGEVEPSWAQEVQQVLKNKLQLLEAAVDSRLGFKAVVAAEKSQMELRIIECRDEILDMKKEDHGKFFDQLFKEGLRRLEKKRPPFAEKVAENVLNLYSEKSDKCFRRKEVNKLIHEDWKFVRSSMADYINSIWRVKEFKLAWNRKRQELQDLWDEVCNYAADGNGVFNELKVINLASKVGRELMRRKFNENDVVRQVHVHACALLIFKMKEGQSKWDEENDTFTMFKNMETELKEFFTDVAKGVHGMDLLKKQLLSTLRNGGDKALRKMASQEGASLVLTKDFSRNSALMALLLERDLVTKVVAHQSCAAWEREQMLDDLLTAVSKPAEHYEELLEENIKKALQGSWISRCVSDFKERIGSAIAAASLEGRASPDGSSKVCIFLQTLSERLPSGFSAAIEGLTEHADSKFNDIQQGMKLEDLPDLMREEMQAWEQELELDSDWVVKGVLQLLRKGHGGMVFQERCTKACPLCYMLCHKVRDHDVADDNSRLHNAVHQPGGLSGRIWVEYPKHEDELVHCSCLQSYEGNHRFKHNDTWVPYKDFAKTFPDWQVPNIQERSHIREYIFYHYHRDIAKRCEKKPCTIPMDKYAHILDHLANRLDARINACTA